MYDEAKSIVKDGRYNLAYFDFQNGFPENLEMKIDVKMIISSTSSIKIATIKDKLHPLFEYANKKDDYYDIDRSMYSDKLHSADKGNN